MSDWDDRSYIITNLLESIERSLARLAAPRQFGLCQDCKYWQFSDGGRPEELRRCVRYAPKINGRTDIDPEIAHCRTPPEYGCGEFEPRVTPDEGAS